MTKIVIGLMLSVMLSACATPRQAVLPDPKIPHRVALPAEVTVWLRRKDGSLAQEVIRVDAGWYVAGPMVVDR